MLNYEEVHIKRDRDLLLQWHAQANYAGDTHWATQVSYARYRDKWSATTQPDSFLKSVADSQQDQRTLAEIWRRDGEAVGWLWLVFHDIEGYGLLVAELNEIAVDEGFRRQGIGRQMFARIEAVAKERGAHVLRSDAGVQNAPSDALHRQSGYAPYRLQYEKLLIDEDELGAKIYPQDGEGNGL